MAQAIIVRSYYFFNLYVNVQLVKRDIITAIIYYYIMTEFHYAKRGSGYGGVTVCMGKNVHQQFSQNFEIFVTKITDLNSNTSIMLKGESPVLCNETWSLCNSIPANFF